MKPIIEKVSERFASAYKKHIKIGKFLVRHSTIRRVLFKIGRIFEVLKHNFENSQRDVHFQNLLSSNEEKGFGYDNLGDIKAFVNYFSETRRPDFEEKSSASRNLYNAQYKSLMSLFEEEKAIDKFLNFGVCLAHIDSRLAKENKNVSFHGVDTSQYVKALNETIFGDIANIQFINGDIFDVLKSKTWENGVLFHSRILIFFPKSFVERLYQTARSSGIKYIVGFEHTGFSRQTQGLYEFSEEDKDSVYFRDRMMMHNYPAIGKKEGYVTSQIELLDTGHPSEDMRDLCFRMDLKE